MDGLLGVAGMMTLRMWWLGSFPKIPCGKRTSKLLLLHVGMDQYLLMQFLGEWTSIYQLFWCSPGVQGFDTLPCYYDHYYHYPYNYWWWMVMVLAVVVTGSGDMILSKMYVAPWFDNLTFTLFVELGAVPSFSPSTFGWPLKHWRRDNLSLIISMNMNQNLGPGEQRFGSFWRFWGYHKMDNQNGYPQNRLQPGSVGGFGGV